MGWRLMDTESMPGSPADRRTAARRARVVTRSLASAILLVFAVSFLSPTSAHTPSADEPTPHRWGPGQTA